VEIIAGHGNTDFDALASMLACRRLFPGAAIALHGSLNRNVREFVRLHAEELGCIEARSLDLDRVTRLILVEAADASRLDDLEPLTRRDAVEVVLFDHHRPEPPGWVGPSNVVLSEDGALTTTLVGILAERELRPTPLEATAFALGIHEDTGSLTYPSATRRDAEALAWCLGHGASQEMVARYLHTPLAHDERALFDALLAALEPVDAGGLDVHLVAVSWPSYVDGVSNLAHKLLDVTDCRGLVCLVEMDGRVVCVVRSRTSELDAEAVATALGGGGHRQAAAAMVHAPLAEARKRALEALPSAIRRQPTAAEIMSRPARFVSEDDTVAHAMALCQRHHQSGIQVGDARHLVGIATREDLDKAIAHGLSHAPVKAVMGAGTVTSSPDTPLAELRRLLATAPAGRIPVLRDGEVVGVVTRSDVLRALGEPEPEPTEGTGRDLAAELHALPGLDAVFEAIQAVSGPFEGVYLVGGTVRDILLGEPNFDVDIAVEGDGIAFARALATALGGRAVPHEKFGTAVVKHGDRGRVDVATTRTEFYDQPAALPTIEQASITQDLYRRDFTINAMGVSLRGDDFGRLVDPFGGLEDLRQGVVRVLHNLSFIDDPTRIFRGIRYENRYGFRMDGHTTALARACIDMGLVGELSSARLRDELVLLLEEERVGDAVLRLETLGLAAAIHPHLAADRESVELLERVDTLRDRYAPGEPRWRARLPVLARRLPSDELYEWFSRLKLRRRDADLLADAIAVAHRLPELLAGVEEPAEARRLIQPHEPIGPLLALACHPDGPAGAWLDRYFEDLRDVSLDISGTDLARFGLQESPRVGAVLAEVLRQKLNGDVPAGREHELALARRLIESGSEPSTTGVGATAARPEPDDGV
jgi:tRNA nucleotidyltransferase (CCA-adding enzyme)